MLTHVCKLHKQKPPILCVSLVQGSTTFDRGGHWELAKMTWKPQYVGQISISAARRRVRNPHYNSSTIKCGAT
jgi:hypothetical protein